MKGSLSYCSIALLVCCLAFSACSQNEGGAANQGAIEEMTDRTADVIGKKIRTPMDQARSVQGLARKRLQRTDKPL